MIRPASFSLNEQTAVNNHFQNDSKNYTTQEIEEKSLFEFDQFVIKLKAQEINVEVFQDSLTPHTPDSIFPNNWISMHQDGTVVLYPMFAPNRRQERNVDLLAHLKGLGFSHYQTVDFTNGEDSNLFLEGTGSLVLDRVNKIAYAAISIRTNQALVNRFCKLFNYQSVCFVAKQTVNGERLAIYHTNVMMCIGTSLAIVCLECIDDLAERQNLKKHILDSGKTLLELEETQINTFAGNMLELRNSAGKAFMVLSTQAFESLRQDQIDLIEIHAEIIHSPLYLIEALGGGSARCMIAEIFLPRKDFVKE